MLSRKPDVLLISCDSEKNSKNRMVLQFMNTKKKKKTKGEEEEEFLFVGLASLFSMQMFFPFSYFSLSEIENREGIGPFYTCIDSEKTN